MYTPDKFQACQPKVIVLKFIEKKWSFGRLFLSPFQRPQTSM